jgi:hypothetical protein
MAEHLLVAAAALPLQVALGALSTRRRVLTRGEVRFWCIVIFVAAELVHLGAGG